MSFIKQHVDAICRLILVNLGIISVLSCILSYTKFTLSIKDIVFSLSICTIIYISCCSNSKARRLSGWVLFALATGYYIYICREQLYPSLLYTINSFIEVLKEPYHLDIPPFKLPDTLLSIDQQPVILLLIVFLAVLFNALIKSIRGSIVLLTVTVPVCLFGLYFGILPDYLSLTGVFSFWLALLVYINGDGSKKAVINAIFAAGSIFIAGILLQVALPKESYKPPQFIQSIPQSIKDFLDNYLSPEGRATSLTDLCHGLNRQGRLGDIDHLTQTGRDIMQVQTSLRSKDRLYLRNYFGAIYNDSSWNDLPEDVYAQYDKLFAAYSPGAWFDQSVLIFKALEDDLAGQAALLSYVKGSKDYNELFAARQFTVSKIFVDREQYVFPYNTDISSPAFKYDKAAQEDGTKTYQAAVFMALPEYSGIAPFIAEYAKNNKYISYYAYTEQEYRSFANKYYRQVPKGVLNGFEQDFPIVPVETKTQRDKFIIRLQKYFQQNYKYTASPGKVPVGKDFVNYFLTESKEGYCTYFASAAVLILRQAGIPARYAVGYAVPDQAIAAGDSASADDNGHSIYSFTIIDRQAHAWVEIYEPAWGWRPVEFTPGYIPEYEDEPIAQNSVDNDTSADKAEVQKKPEDNAAPPEEQKKPEAKNEQTKEKLENQLPATDEKPDISHYLQTGLIIFFAVVVIGTLGYLWKRKCDSQLYQRFIDNTDSESSKKHIIALYMYLEKLAGYLNLHRAFDVDYLVYAGYLRESEERWRDIPLENFAYTVLKARFDCDAVIEKQELSDALLIIKNMRDKIYNDLNFWQKILFVYIHRL